MAQVKISGKITDNHNKPLRGISISIKILMMEPLQIRLGNYSFTTTEKGDQLCRHQFNGL